ncbi:MAG: DM13 domain-containing protein [Actinomycetota bacterium]
MEKHGRRFTRRTMAVGAGVAVVAAVVVVVWFQPQKLFIDERVDEAAPAAMAEPDEAPAPDDGPDEDAPAFTGDFRSIDHETSGRVVLAPAADGRYYARLQDFQTENGPDLFVYLSAAPASAEGRVFADEFVDLGPLRGNLGNQNYVVPEGTDIERYRSIVIWCRRFTSPFGAAPLERA